MKNKKLIITMVVCVLLIAATIGGLYLYTKKADTPAVKPAPSPDGSTATTPASAFPLKKGSRGNLVAKLQTKMNEWMNYYYFTLGTKPSNKSLAVDGIFGVKTLEFVQIIFNSTTVTEANYNWILGTNYSAGVTEKPFWQIW